MKAKEVRKQDQNNKPGVMIYFDIRPAIQRLSLEERGIIFTAILDFAELGVVPELDGMAGMCFDLIRPKIERDSERYKLVKSQRRYATYCREVKKAGGVPVPFDEWLSDDNHPVSPDAGWYPTTTTSATTSSTAAATATTSSSATAAAEAEGEVEGLQRGAERKPRPIADNRCEMPLSPEEFEREKQKQLALLRGDIR